MKILLQVALLSSLTMVSFGQKALPVNESAGQTQETHQSLKQVLKDLEKHYHVSILTDQRLIEDQMAEPLTRYQSITRDLDFALRNTGLEYKLVADNFYVIILKRQDVVYASSLTASVSSNQILTELIPYQQADSKILGKVTSQTGEILAGVTIAVAGTTQGTVTDADGHYELTLAPGNYTLNISFIGYESLAQPITIGNENVNLDFVLKESIESLGEVVVLGSRGVAQRTSTSSPVPIDAITTKELKSFSQVNIGDILNM